ncbi:MAG: histidinol dehydrogenase [Bacteroidaceae bacterium]|nr:histidinol dehydrogenase [Bacteroidaceae bacterium]
MDCIIKRYIEPGREEWNSLCERRLADDEIVAERVNEIVERVKEGGDDALCALAAEIDGVTLQALEVTPEERHEAFEQVPQDLRDAIAKAARNITKFHMAQRFEPVRVETVPGVLCVQRAVPINSVGLYVPGGTAPLFSTMLMLAIPAKVAGCKNIILCTPTDKEGKVAPAVLFAAMVCGVERIFKVGGAQAIAAMAYGTETIPAVDKIFGPGNRYVTKAKEMLSRRVAIDMPAGPSEVLVVADRSAVPSFVASDLLSQAEHGADSQAILVCSDETVADAVCSEVERQLQLLPRKDIAMKALANSRVIVLSDPDDRIAFIDCYAPEHLIISTDDPWGVSARITSAGSVFIGNYTPESAGDYASGTNHTLPTSGWARSHSGVNVDSFVRKITFQEATTAGLLQLGDTIVTMARAEGLDAHANAVIERLRSCDTVSE